MQTKRERKKERYIQTHTPRENERELYTERDIYARRETKRQQMTQMASISS